MRHISHFALCIVTLLAIVGALASQSAAQVIPAPDEKEIETMINDMGSADPVVRKAASDRLEHCGSEVVPMLQKYADNDDPEIAARVKRVIHAYDWMRTGAILIEIEKGTQAEKLGLQLGDVIVKIDDMPIKSHMDIRGSRSDMPAMVYLWRGGKVRVVKVAAGRMGIQASNWDIARGGNDHSRGLAALAAKPPDYDEAYRRLRAARDQGMNDGYSMGFLAGLAARALDTKYAAEAYSLFRPGNSCMTTHDTYDAHLQNVPIDSPHCQWLLDRYHTEVFSTELNHELEDWFARNGRNGPMAAELLKTPWPVGRDQIPRMSELYHEIAQMLVWLNDRRYDDVVKVFDGRGYKGFLWYDRQTVAIQAAVRAGHSADAVRIGLTMFNEPDRLDFLKPYSSLWAFAGAAANGDDVSADLYLASLDRFGDDTIKMLSTMGATDALNQPAAADKLRRWLATRPKAEHPGRFEQIALARLATAPETTADEFSTAVVGLDPEKLDNEWRAALVTGLLRFGEYEKAKKAAGFLSSPKKSATTSGTPRVMALAAIAFGNAHATELAGAWKKLQGFVQVVPDHGDPGAMWVLRYDGAVFLVDHAGVHHFDGLCEPPAPISVGYPHLRVSADSVAVVYPYGRENVEKSKSNCADMTFVFDAKQGKFLPLAESDGPLDLADRDHKETIRALAIREVAKKYPALAGGIPRENMENDNYCWFEGDILIYVDPKNRTVTDLATQIGRLAERARPAHIYRIQKPTATPLIYSDCGVWAFDAATSKIVRVPLGLKDENVMTCPMSETLYGHRADGTVLVGVSPQQGGKIFVVNPQTSAVQATEGFCGLGPIDWYAVKGQDWSGRDPQPWIHAQYLARLAAKAK